MFDKLDIGRHIWHSVLLQAIRTCLINLISVDTFDTAFFSRSFKRLYKLDSGIDNDILFPYRLLSNACCSRPGKWRLGVTVWTEVRMLHQYLACVRKQTFSEDNYTMYMCTPQLFIPLYVWNSINICDITQHQYQIMSPCFQLRGVKTLIKFQWCSVFFLACRTLEAKLAIFLARRCKWICFQHFHNLVLHVILLINITSL